jgi:type III secretory pathway lipoprotein EscJ
MIKDMYLKSKTLEKTIKEMKQVFTKCVKIALHLYNKDDLPLEILM